MCVCRLPRTGKVPGRGASQVVAFKNREEEEKGELDFPIGTPCRGRRPPPLRPAPSPPYPEDGSVQRPRASQQVGSEVENVAEPDVGQDLLQVIRARDGKPRQVQVQQAAERTDRRPQPGRGQPARWQEGVRPRERGTRLPGTLPAVPEHSTAHSPSAQTLQSSWPLPRALQASPSDPRRDPARCPHPPQSEGRFLDAWRRARVFTERNCSGPPAAQLRRWLTFPYVHVCSSAGSVGLASQRLATPLTGSPSLALRLSRSEPQVWWEAVTISRGHRPLV